jgi:hypothetical protein
MFRFQPSVECLETRETPSSTLASTTDLLIDSYNPQSYPGTGVYKSVDSGKTWTLAPDSTSTADAKPLPVLLVIADQY